VGRGILDLDQPHLGPDFWRYGVVGVGGGAGIYCLSSCDDCRGSEKDAVTYAER
jgi:hypothetical protein